jgi:hypothetical protein
MEKLQIKDMVMKRNADRYRHSTVDTSDPKEPLILQNFDRGISVLAEINAKRK